MDKLAQGLRYYISSRIDNEPGWSGVQVIFSDSSVPGEGEHKIMEFIRKQRNSEGYDPCMKHCMYGMDADLIMLCLATHETNFSIVREIVFFGKNESSRCCPICGNSAHFAAECTSKVLYFPGYSNNALELP